MITSKKEKNLAKHLDYTPVAGTKGKDRLWGRGRLGRGVATWLGCRDPHPPAGGGGRRATLARTPSREPQLKARAINQSSEGDEDGETDVDRKWLDV